MLYLLHNFYVHIMTLYICRDEFEQGVCAKLTKGEDSVRSQEGAEMNSGDGLVDGSSVKGREMCVDKIAERNGSSEKEGKDDGPR